MSKFTERLMRELQARKTVVPAPQKSMVPAPLKHPVSASTQSKNQQTVYAIAAGAQAASPLSIPTAPGAPPASREALILRDEKVMFVKAVCDFKVANPRLGMDKCCVLVADRDREILPELHRQKLLDGRRAYSNFRNWTEGRPERPALRNPATGQIDYSRADLLLPAYRSGFQERMEGDKRFWTALRAAFLQENKTKLTKLYRRTATEWIARDPEIKLPSLAQVTHYYKQQYPERFTAMMRRGETHYLQRYRDYIERDPDSIQPNQGWVADTQKCDFMIQSNGKAVRPSICVIMDIKSQHVISIQFTADAVNHQTIRNGLALGIVRYGRPQYFLTDNGTDFLKDGFTEPVLLNSGTSTQYAHSILRELDIEHRKAEAYNARAKIVERFFKEVAEYSREARGYLGNEPKDRPAKAELWARSGNCEHLMNEYAACEFIAGIVNSYHALPSHGKYLKGLTPAQAFAPGLRFSKPEMSLDALYRAFLMPLPEPRIVDPRGPSVHVARRRYTADPEGYAALIRRDGKPVMVKIAPFDTEHVFAFDLDGTYICRCTIPPLVPYFAETHAEKKLLAAEIKRIKHAKKQLRTMALRETGGFERLDPQTIISLPPEAFEGKPPAKLLDSRTSVKGDTHNPKIYVLPGEVGATDKSDPSVKPALPPPPPDPKKRRRRQLSQDIENHLLAPKTTARTAIADEPINNPKNRRKIDGNHL